MIFFSDPSSFCKLKLGEETITDAPMSNFCKNFKLHILQDQTIKEENKDYILITRVKRDSN